MVRAGTTPEKAARRTTSPSTAGTTLATTPADGSSFDGYASGKPNSIATNTATNTAKNSGTVAMIQAIQAAAPTKTALVLKDNAGVAMDPALVSNPATGVTGPAILEVWFPGQED